MELRGHSHVNMGVGPSGQDDSMILEFKTRDFFIRGIFNKKGDIKMDIYDFKNNIKYLDVNPEFESDITDEEKQRLYSIPRILFSIKEICQKLLETYGC